MGGRAGRVLVAIALLRGAVAAGADDSARSARPCPATGAVIAVVSRTHELHLCRDGNAEASIPVAMGRGGMDKRRQNDRRTPVGTYAAGDPRRSARFGTFIPIDYPTPEQAARGYTGGGLGIHGPPRGWHDAAAARALDWTTGCIATGTDQDVERIARFVREHRPVTVDVR